MPANIPLTEKQPPRRYKGRGETAPIPEPWVERFLEHYAKWGGISNAAKVSGVTVPYVKKHQEANSHFSEQCHLALEAFRDSLEERLVEISKGTNMPAVVSILASLKKHRPGQWNEQLQITGAIAHIHSAPAPEEMKGLLQAMLRDSMPETRKQISGEVIDVDRSE